MRPGLSRPVGRLGFHWIDGVRQDAESLIEVRSWRTAAEDRPNWSFPGGQASL